MSAVGSTVQGLPVVASLRRAWPEAHLTWILQPGPAALMAGRTDVDRILLFRRELGRRAYARFRRDVAHQAAGESFDLVLSLQPNFKGALVTRLLPAPVRLGHDRRRTRDLSWLATNRRLPPRPVAHIQDELLEFLDVLGVPRRLEWDFQFSPRERAEAQAWRAGFDGPVLALIARSSNPHRNWILDRAARVLDAAAADLGLRTVLLGGDSGDELRDAGRLAELCSSPPHSALGGTLRQLAGRLAVSDLVLAPDTGPLHMAVALGTPTVGLYACTDPRRSGPYQRFHDLLIDRYSRQSEHGAGRARVSRASHRRRMSRIGVDDVLEKLEHALRAYG